MALFSAMKLQETKSTPFTYTCYEWCVICLNQELLRVFVLELIH